MKTYLQSIRCSVLLLFLLLVTLQTSQADLKSFLAKPEPAYKWEKVSEQKMEGGTVYELHMVSQTWKDSNWEHKIQIFRPDKVEHPDYCALYNTGGNGSNENTAMGMELAKRSGVTYAIMFGNPKQPLYGGKTEDALIVYTWQQYFLTGDDTWPLHFPMAKAVLKAMDSIQAFTKEAGQPAIEHFIVTGASKRGWTTWLVGASQDARVAAIAPMVIDVLNVQKQMEHQLEHYGQPSEEVGDYTAGGMMKAINTPRGKQLMALEDPYSYRDILTLPKLIILGTNDPYWSQDSLNLYWDDLKGPKWVTYTPNSGHGLDDRPHVYSTLSAFIRMIAGHKKFPKMDWSYAETPDGVELTIKSDMTPKSARIFHNAAPTRDFRKFKNWTSDPITVSGKTATGYTTSPKEGWVATFGEVTYEIDGQPYTLSTQIRLLPAKK